MSQDTDLMDIVQRVARLESEYEIMSKQHSGLTTRLDVLIRRFDRYEAKWGGVLMVLSALAALVLAFKAEIMRFLGGR